jgi:hypothetical protein
MKAFKPKENKNPAISEWDNWSSLYLPKGGSIDMRKSYEGFLKSVSDKQISKEYRIIHEYT